MITANTVVVNCSPRINSIKFAEVLLSNVSPATGDAFAMFDAIVAEGIDPAFLLACFKRESRYATDPASIVVRYQNFNMGNCRSSRIGVTDTVTDPEKGVYVKYPDWATGAKDAAFRLVDKSYDYAKAGATTIGEIIKIWAPGGDGANDPIGYANTVVNQMNLWIGSGGSSMAPKPGNITWVGSPNHWTGRDGNAIIAIVDHIMQGTMASTAGWFNNTASQVSSTFGVGKDGSIAQYVALENAAWANGIAENIDTSVPWLVSAISNNINENNLTVSIEHEGNTGDVMPEAQYQATLALHRWLVGLYGIPVDRSHILGHYQISGHIKANCPGTGFPWSRLMSDLSKGGATVLTTDNHTPLPKPDPNMVNGHVLGGGFKTFYDKLAAISPNFQLLVLGLPVTDEFDCDVNGDGKLFTVQLFERSALIYEAANFTPWDIHATTLAQLERVVADAKTKGFLTNL